MTRKKPDGAVSVSLLALPETTPTAIYGLYEVFASVGVSWSEITGGAAGGPPMEPRIVGLEVGPIKSPLGILIAPHSAIEEVNRTDIVIVTDLALSLDEDKRGRWKAQTAWVRRMYEEGATVCSVCTGSVFLAEARLLGGEEATTHWSAAELFRRFYPDVKLRPERILCPAGIGHRIVTSGGASSWSDLALYLIARFSSEREAVRAAKVFVLGDRSEGQLPFSAMARPRQHDDAIIGECQRWIAQHYTASNPVTRMVAKSGLPTRTFKRRFKAATGYAPVDYVQALRIEEAKQILEATGDPTDAVAHAVGYEDPAFFRRLFKRRTGVTPSRYRQRFRSIAQLAKQS